MSLYIVLWMFPLIATLVGLFVYWVTRLWQFYRRLGIITAEVDKFPGLPTRFLLGNLHQVGFLIVVKFFKLFNINKESKCLESNATAIFDLE